MIGQTACDESYSTGDSYSVQTEYLVKVSRSQQMDPLTRQTARATALDYLANRFNTLPLGIKRGAVLVTSDSKLVFYDGVSVTPMLSLPRPSTQVYQSADLLKFYDPITQVLSASYDGANLLTEETDYDMNLGPRNFVDRYRTQRANCWLFTNRLICEFPEKRVNLPITGFTPAGFQSYSLQDRFEKKVRIVSKERQVYSVTSDSTGFYPEATDYLNTGKWDENTTIGLSYDGQVYFEGSGSALNQGTTAKRLAPGLDSNTTYIKMIAPYYWSPELQKL
jgi:hypothetical protein